MPYCHCCCHCIHSHLCLGLNLGVSILTELISMKYYKNLWRHVTTQIFSNHTIIIIDLELLFLRITHHYMQDQKHLLFLVYKPHTFLLQIPHHDCTKAIFFIELCITAMINLYHNLQSIYHKLLITNYEFSRHVSYCACVALTLFQILKNEPITILLLKNIFFVFIYWKNRQNGQDSD